MSYSKEGKAKSTRGSANMARTAISQTGTFRAAMLPTKPSAPPCPIWHCPPLRFPPPWDILPAPRHCRGPVANPTTVLADLRAQFDEATFRAAKILSTSSEEGLYLSPLEPVQAWALASSDAVVRKVGMELTRACHLPHRLSPLLFTLQTRQFESAVATASEPLPTKAFAQYLALTVRLGQLIRDLCQWRNT
jgi:hypothetical protein